jgi:thioredoxin reductase (NADPH)
MSDVVDALSFDDAELALLEPRGTRRGVEAGEYLYREGDTAYDFYVVLSGQVDVTVTDHGRERLITTHPARASSVS